MVHKDRLEPFVKAKQNINSIFSSFNNFLQECSVLLCESKIADSNNFSSQVSDILDDVSSISKVIARDQMKVAFFGRTSSGKSTTVNAMLQDQILPMGMGHTTNCFVSVHGSDEPDPYILIAGSDKKMNVESLSHLVHALSDGNLGCSSLVQVFWPKTRCELLSEDVVLVDSPGLDVSSDVDSWIDKYCLDADVLVVVVNAESTLMMTEKKFAHKVKDRLSRPNIFILNNRWDATAFEPANTIELVKNQHLQRSISFLVDELECVEEAQAKDRVFFVSSTETLMTRMQKHKGMPLEGFQARQKEFENFETKFEECISKSAIQTKFKSHAVSGLKFARTLDNIMGQVEGCALQRSLIKCYYDGFFWRSRLEEMKKETEDMLKYITGQLEICDRNVKVIIERTKCKVEEQVTDAMTKGIGRFESLVNEFDHPFYPYPTLLNVYKKELYEHVEKGLDRNITACCSKSQTQVINNAQRDMADCLRSVVPQESPENVFEPDATFLDFQAISKLNARSICDDFNEDIEFHFSREWLEKILAPHLARLVNPVAANLQRNGRNFVPTAQYNTMFQSTEFSPASTTPNPLALSDSTWMAILTGGLVWGTGDSRWIGLFPFLYTGKVAIELFRLTNAAKEKAFKEQFVKYATEKLHLAVSSISANCGILVQQTLTSWFVELKSSAQRSKELLEEKINELCKEIARLEKIEKEANIQRDKASSFEDELSQFITDFGSAKCKI